MDRPHFIRPHFPVMPAMDGFEDRSTQSIAGVPGGLCGRLHGGPIAMPTSIVFWYPPLGLNSAFAGKHEGPQMDIINVSCKLPSTNKSAALPKMAQYS